MLMEWIIFRVFKLSRVPRTSDFAGIIWTCLDIQVSVDRHVKLDIMIVLERIPRLESRGNLS